jgi:predicted Rossmann fold flavoprotein
MKMKTSKDDVWDVVVIGGGPAGMMAAGRAAELGHAVLLLEKNPTLGKKLLLTGGGRCNLTNYIPEIDTMLAHYTDNERFLFSAFAQFGAQDTLDFFHRRGMATKEEAEGRVFPLSSKAQSVLEVLSGYLREGRVEVWLDATVTGLSVERGTGRIEIRLGGGKKIQARTCIMATGGTAHPETGSSGEGLEWLKRLGHSVTASKEALVPIALQDDWVKGVIGLTLQEIKMTVFLDGRKRGVQRGDLLFTHFGVSGPTVLNMSREIGEWRQASEVVITLDLFPQLDHAALKENLQTLLAGESNRMLKNSLGRLVPSALVPVILELAQLDGEIPGHSVRHKDRIKIIELLKGIPLHVEGLLGAESAAYSSGGVAPGEMNFKTMQSRLAPNVYIVGDLLDIDRPSGGYSLQLCWTTGFVAGSHISKERSADYPN